MAINGSVTHAAQARWPGERLDFTSYSAAAAIELGGRELDQVSCLQEAGVERESVVFSREDGQSMQGGLRKEILLGLLKMRKSLTS
jgi:hypothetical protein